jgi:hypothetical protein
VIHLRRKLKSQECQHIHPCILSPEKERRGLGVEEVPVVTQAANAELPQEKTDDSLADSKDKEPKVVIKLCAHFFVIFFISQ